jgi:hypothetical protein
MCIQHEGRNIKIRNASRRHEHYVFTKLRFGSAYDNFFDVSAKIPQRIVSPFLPYLGSLTLGQVKLHELSMTAKVFHSSLQEVDNTMSQSRTFPLGRFPAGH